MSRVLSTISKGTSLRRERSRLVKEDFFEERIFKLSSDRRMEVN